MNRVEIEKILEEKEWLIDYTIKTDFPCFIGDEDVRQLAFIAMWKALESYKKNNEATMESYCRKCIIYRLRNEIKKRAGDKYKLNSTSYVRSLDEKVYMEGGDNEDITLGDTIADPHEDGNIIDLRDYIKELPDNDREIVYRKINGQSLTEIAVLKNCTKENIRIKLKRIKRDVMKNVY